MCTEIFEHVFSDDLHKEETHDFSSKKKDIVGKTTHILYHLNDSRPYIRSILSCESGEMFMKYFKEYLLNHMVCDFAETVRWWMKHEQYSAEEISRFFFSTTPF